MHIAQTLPKTLKTRQRPRRNLAIEAAISIDTRTEAHVLAQAIDDDELPVTVTSYDQVKTIGT
jgi:hypothetical protein